MTQWEQERQQKREWLHSLQPGDEVISKALRPGNIGRIVKVERVTATQIVADGDRFHKDDGRQLGRSTYNTYLYPPDEAHLQLIRRRELMGYIESTVRYRDVLSRLTLAQLEQIKAVLESAPEEPDDDDHA